MKKINIEGKIQAWLIDEKTGEIEECFVKDFLSYKKNRTPKQYLTDIASLNRGISTDIEIKYIALSAKFSAPSETSALEGEIMRVELTSIDQINNKLIIEGLFDNSMFTKNCEIVSIIDQKTIVVNSAAGFSVNERIRCKVNGNWEERELVDITGTTFTFNENFSSSPTTGVDNCQQMVSRLHLIYGADATEELNSGKGISIAVMKTIKPSTKLLYTRHEIEYFGS